MDASERVAAMREQGRRKQEAYQARLDAGCLRPDISCSVAYNACGCRCTCCRAYKSKRNAHTNHRRSAKRILMTLKSHYKGEEDVPPEQVYDLMYKVLTGTMNYDADPRLRMTAVQTFDRVFGFTEKSNDQRQAILDLIGSLHSEGDNGG